MKQIQEDKIISEFLKSLGPWREFVVIGGGFAIFIYKLYLADPKLENLPVGTRDIDSLIPRRVPEISKKNIAKYLNEAGFTHVFKDVDIPARQLQNLSFVGALQLPLSTKHLKSSGNFICLG